MEANIGEWIFRREDNRPFWETGLRWKFSLWKNLASTRKLPNRLAPLYKGSNIRVNRRLYAESFPLLTFPTDCKNGFLEFQFEMERRPQMYPKMEPILTCDEAPDLSPISFRYQVRKKSAVNRESRRFDYLDETYRAKVDLTRLYRSLRQFFETQKRLRGKDWDHGEIHFRLHVRAPSARNPVLVCERSIKYFFPSFDKRMRKFLSGRQRSE